MNEQDSAASKELNFLLQSAGQQINSGIGPGEFLEWFRNGVPTIAPQFARSMATAEGKTDAMIYSMGRALWNAMPQPSNRYRPRPLPRPDRNARCPCGSGRKFKQCCAQLDPPREMFESINLLGYVLDGLSMTSLKRVDARAMDPAALDDVANQWVARGKYERALALLEPLFDEGTKPPKHAGLLLDTLFDIWPPNHKPQRRRRLAERLVDDSNPSVACVALHRCIVMLSDKGSMEEAWARFHAGMRQYPNEVNFAGLEITLLLTENRLDEARRRAEFWAHWLRRQGPQYYAYAERILSMAEPREDQKALDRARAESSLIDEIARLIESPAICTDGYASRPAAADQPIVLTPTRAMAATEQRWWEDVGGNKSSLALFDSGSELLGLEQMVVLLEEDPKLVHSFAVLDELCESLEALRHEWAELSVLLELVLQRAETMLFAIVTGRAPANTVAEWVTAENWREALPDIVHEVPWEFLENVSALRMMARHVNQLSCASIGNVERWLPRAQALIRINPHDNHGYRDLVSCELLRQRRPAEALRLLDQYPDDALGAICMNRVLAFYLLSRKDEAASCLSGEGASLREIRKGITQERYAKPRDIDESRVVIGGRDEAWFYRHDMRSIWKDVGAIEWLKQQPTPRKSPKRKPKAMGAQSSEAQSQSVSSPSSGEEPNPSTETPHEPIEMSTLLSHPELRACMENLAPNGEWLLGLTLAAALTPSGGYDVKRLIQPLLDRLGYARLPGGGLAFSGTAPESIDSVNEIPSSDTLLAESKSIEQLAQALGPFVELYHHFLSRLDLLPDYHVSPEAGAAARNTSHKTSSSDESYDWVAEDLSVVSLDEPEVRLAIVSGLVAEIDGNPRGWASVPTSARNNVIGPLRLMVVEAGQMDDTTGSDLGSASLFGVEDSDYQLSREECLEQIVAVVRLGKLARR